jgi:hypothetical protein
MVHSKDASSQALRCNVAQRAESDPEIGVYNNMMDSGAARSHRKYKVRIVFMKWKGRLVSTSGKLDRGQELFSFTMMTI